MINLIDKGIAIWEKKKNHVRYLYEFDGRVNVKEITYFIENVRIVDLSLIYDHSIFEFKPPKIYKSLLCANRDQIIQVMSHLVEFQKRKWKKPEDIDQAELSHIIILQNLIDNVLQRKLGEITGGNLKSDLSLLKDKKRILAGDFKSRTHFSV